MYLHIGEDFLIPSEEIIYIIPFESLSADSNKNFLKGKKISKTSKNTMVRSIIGCYNGDIYMSPIKSKTLKERFRTK